MKTAPETEPSSATEEKTVGRRPATKAELETILKRAERITGEETPEDLALLLHEDYIEDAKRRGGKFLEGAVLSRRHAIMAAVAQLQNDASLGLVTVPVD